MHIKLFEDWGSDSHEEDERYAFEQTELGDGSSPGVPYFCNCVAWDSMGDIEELHHIIDHAEPVNRRYFMSRVANNDAFHLAEELGYAFGTDAMENDPYIDYYRSRNLKNEVVYYFWHSAIEYVFMERPDDEDDEAEY